MNFNIVEKTLNQKDIVESAPNTLEFNFWFI